MKYTLGMTSQCFGKDADIALATNRLVRTSFTSIGFFSSGTYCARQKLYIGLGLTIAATLCYLLVEYFLKKDMWPPERGNLGEKTEENKEKQTEHVNPDIVAGTFKAIDPDTRL